MIKYLEKYILLFVILFGVSFASVASATLWSYYNEQGQNLPPVDERALEYVNISSDTYTGLESQNLALEAYLRGGQETLGGTLPVAGVSYNLAGSGITSSATSIILQSLTIPQTGYELTDADFSSTFYVTLEPGNTKRQEIVSCTTVTQGTGTTATLSGCSRGLLPFSPYTASTTYAFSHGGGSMLIFSDAPQLFNEYPAKSNNETITGFWSFPTPLSASTSAPSTVGYANALAFSGVATSSESNFGGVWLGTQVNMASSTYDVNAPTVVYTRYTSSTCEMDGICIPTTENDGYLNQNVLDLTESWTFTGTTALSTTTMFGTQGGLMPAGSITAYATGTAPTGWLNADGTSVSTTAYADLFAVVGYSYGGSGDSFNLPNLDGRMIVGLGSATTTYDTMGETGGEDEHVLTIDEMPSHTHSSYNSGGTDGGTGGASHGASNTGATGGDAAHNNMPPFMVLYWMIKY